MGERESRTVAQIEADKLDLDLFNLSRSLECFAGRIGDREVDDASRVVFGLRGRLQRHMHRNDIKRLAPSPSQEGRDNV